ncbi:MAG TPA: hypothetical protein PLF32_02665 [Bacteroidales bacterium]|nr:hypothetical protein [Bacteroidales bacterium]HOR81541.1 hypothetical protein [Bacteroidales bacterium]HPJ90381.1 hypothetical protein [Bacteroidales bacterium]
MAKNIYQHSIDLKKIEIKNSNKEEFAKKLIDIPYRGYEVESLLNGNKIVITKPGGKSVYGKPKKEDFLVFIYNPKENTLWQISHKQIFNDIVEKSNENKLLTIKLIDLMERTLNGQEPNDFIQEISELNFTTGETPETLVKVYKWIWGQEDVNYPNSEGRLMSWHSFIELREKLIK